jgi:hypothetical protein
VTAHALFTHATEPFNALAQGLLHAPQCASVEVVSTHAVPHNSRPDAHGRVHTFTIGSETDALHTVPGDTVAQS